MSMLLDFLWFVGAHIARIICDTIIVLLSPILFLYYKYTRNKFIHTKKFKSIFITGGSSGIGKAIALQFIKTNPNRTIIITGTNKNRLTSAVRELKSLASPSTIIQSKILDVCDKDGMKQYILEMDTKYTLDLIIANAGTAPDMLPNAHYFESCEKVLNVNCKGVLNTILPIIPRFQERKNGHIAVTGSIAGFLPCCYEYLIYSATKCYERYLCDDLRPKVKLIGNIDVSYIAPGIVRSRMIDEKKFGHRLGFMTENEAAKNIIHGLENNETVIAFPNNVFAPATVIGTLHPIVNVLFNDLFGAKFFGVDRPKAVECVGFYHEFDPDDEFGGEC